MRVGPDKGRAGFGEALDVQVVADAVTGPREMDAVLGSKRLEELVVVGVLVVELDDVVVNVLDREGDLHPVHAHPLELQARHRAGRVLQ